MWIVPKARTGKHVYSLSLVQLNDKHNISRNRQTWRSTALHKSRSVKVATPLQQTKLFSKWWCFFVLSVCAVRHEILCTHVIIWQAEGEDFLWTTEISPCDLLCGQLLGYTATCWLRGSCTAAGSCFKKYVSFKFFTPWLLYHVWYFVTRLTLNSNRCTWAYVYSSFVSMSTTTRWKFVNLVKSNLFIFWHQVNTFI